jgi:hypothetical protein
MSGGTFEYKDRNLDELVDKIIYETIFCEDEKVQKRVASIVKRLKVLSKEIKALDYYLSGDTSTF